MESDKEWDFCFNPRLLDDLLLSVSQDKKLKIYYNDASAFVDYLKKCNETSVKYVYLDADFKRKVKVDAYFNRYTPKYRRRIYAKFKALERWTKSHFKGFITLLTLTTYQRGKTISECLDLLQESKASLVHILRNARRKILFFEYLWVIEPHKSGYPHCHMILLTSKELDSDFEEQLKKLWSKKYGAGSKEHGLKLGSDENGVKKSQSVEYLAQYLYKYIGKSISLMSPAYLVYHSQVWKRYKPAAKCKGAAYQCIVETLPDGRHKVTSPGKGAYRLWGASQKLNEVMRSEVKTNDDNYISVFSCGADSQHKLYEKNNVDLICNIYKRRKLAAFEELLN